MQPCVMNAKCLISLQKGTHNNYCIVCPLAAQQGASIKNIISRRAGRHLLTSGGNNVTQGTFFSCQNIHKMRICQNHGYNSLHKKFHFLKKKKHNLCEVLDLL